MRLIPAAAFALVLCPLVSRAQLVSSGFPVSNPNWEILITDYGYADLLFDLRPGFEKREFLSGEWAAAVCYTKGGNRVGPIWFQPQWFFPDWVSNSDFGVQTGVHPIGQNADGFTMLQSVITNADLRITMTYEMLDSMTGIEQGDTPESSGGAGMSITSDRYIFRQTYKIENISGTTLSGIKFYQFMHGLETGVSTYDDRNYGGAMAEYRYDNTQKGTSFGFDSRSGEIVEHSDVIAFHAMMLPTAWEVGYFGKRGVDDHSVGKPSVGVHLKVEADMLDGTDFFDPPEDRWVSGAQRFELGTLAPGAMTTINTLLSIQTSFQLKFAPVNVIVEKIEIIGDEFVIEFAEPLGAPVGFIPRKSPDIEKPLEDWEQLFLPYTILPNNKFRFRLPIDPGTPKCFFAIEIVIQN